MIRRLIDNDDKIPMLYTVKNLTFTGNNFVDTGVKLWDSAKKFTILISYQSYMSGGNDYYTIFGSEYHQQPFAGFVIDMNITAYGDNPVLGRAGGSGNMIAPHLTSMKDYKKCTVLKNEGLKRTVFSNDKYPDGIDVSPTTLYYHNQTALLGCAMNKSRYWNGIVYTCNIYDQALTNEQIVSLMKKES